MKETKDRLRNVFLLLRCTKASHKNCKPVRNALMSNFKNVLQSYTTNAVVDGIEYCVAGNVLIKDSEIDKFEKNLKKMQTASTRPVSVAEFDMFVEN